MIHQPITINLSLKQYGYCKRIDFQKLCQVHLIQINRKTFKADNLKKILENNDIVKIFQFARYRILAEKSNGIS